MLCDDSAAVRAALGRLLESDPGVRVVARAANGREALDAFAALAPPERPEVVLLDLEMPVMDGMAALPLLLRGEPRPAVVVASALTQRGAAAAMAALRAGASDYVPKPTASGGGGGGVAADAAFRAELLEKVKGWARVRRRSAEGRPPPAPGGEPAHPPARGEAAPTVTAPRGRSGGTARASVGLAPAVPLAVGIGSSTGGPKALAAFFAALRPVPPVPIVVVQHMPAGFTATLADHLGRLGAGEAAEARDGERLVSGRIYVAPGDRHLVVEAAGGAGRGAGLVARLTAEPPEHHCRPAVDPMLRSLARACGGRVVAVVLTGMGQDGAEGCAQVARAGGTVLAQDEASSVVWGMPGAVARGGLAEALLPPEGLARAVAARFGHPVGLSAPAPALAASRDTGRGAWGGVR